MTSTLRVSVFRAIAFLVGLLATVPMGAGTYFQLLECPPPNTQCILKTPPLPPSCPDGPCTVTAFGITHPLGYTGSELLIDINICSDATAADFVPALRRAVSTWNGLDAQTGNCVGCVTHEETAPPITDFNAETTLLHELGHCALGLGHIDRLWDVTGDGLLDATSYAWSVETFRILPGDVNRGNLDDKQEMALMGSIADSLTWFRQVDNDPAIVDSTVIDIDTYSRSVQSNLPVGHTWGASGNRKVNEIAPILQPNTQSVMYSRISSGTEYLALSADDVNMVRMARTGVNLLAGDTDDYFVVLNYVGDCSNPHDIRVRSADIGPGALGVCDNTDIDYSFPPFNPLLARHFSLIPEAGLVPEIVMNTRPTWDLGTPDISFTGSCPGSVTLNARELVPGGQVALLRSTALGNSPLPSGPCANTPTGLDNPTLVSLLTADDAGKVMQSATLQGAACSAVVQVVDMTTCGVSNVEAVP